jgi:hypothetical protein
MPLLLLAVPVALSTAESLLIAFGITVVGTVALSNAETELSYEFLGKPIKFKTKRWLSA